MRDDPSGAALLNAARLALTGEVMPALTGRARYVAAMVANAMGIAAREIEQGGGAARTWDRALATAGTATCADLVTAIRAGRHDADPVLYAALAETAAAAAEIWKPPVPAGGA